MRRLVKYLRARGFERDLASEIEAHLEEKIERLTQEGIPQAEARMRALREFGNRTLIAESCRRHWAFPWFDEFFQNLRYAVRMLWKNPLLSVVAVMTLALGIGSNTTVFSAVSHVLLRSLPYPHSDHLFALWSRSASRGDAKMHVSAADFYDWREQSRAFESLAAYAGWPMNLTGIQDPTRLETQLVSASFFSTLGVEAEIGRTFLPGEDNEQRPPVVVISHHLWRALGESPQIIGRKVILNGSPATVIGVMPSAFAFPSAQIDAWAPLSLSAENRSDRGGRWLAVIAGPERISHRVRCHPRWSLSHGASPRRTRRPTRVGARGWCR